MICLTFDIHHDSLGTGNQHHCDITEIQTAQIAHKLISEAKIKGTAINFNRLIKIVPKGLM